MASRSLTLRLPDRTFLFQGPDEIINHMNTFWAGFRAETGVTHDRSHTITESAKNQVLRRGDRTLWKASDPDQFHQYFERWLIDHYTDSLPAECLLFHAGGVLFDRTLIGLVGGPGAGKTTATDHVLDRGGLYVSDEMVAVDPAHNRVYSFPRPLSYHHENSPRPVSDTVEHCRVQGAEYGMVSDDRIAPLTTEVERIALFVLNRSEDAGDITPMKAGEGMLSVMPHLFRPRDGSERLSALRSLIRADGMDTTLYECSYAEISRVTQSILETGVPNNE